MSTVASTDPERRNREVAMRYVREVMGERNLDAVEELFAPPSDWKTVSLYGDVTVESVAELREYYDEELLRLEEFAVESVVADESEVLVRWQASGLVTAAFPAVPVAGKSFETTAVTSFEFEDGEIVALRVHANQLDLLPEVSWPAVRRMIGEMRDGVMVIDDDDRIVHVNPATVDLLGASRPDLVGTSVGSLLDGRDCESDVRECTVTATDDGTYVSVSESPLTDAENREIGRLLVFRDVTERRRRVQGLSVLNRVLRHDLRNALSVVRGRLDAVDGRADPAVADLLEPARRQTERLLSTAETARHVQTALDESATTRQDLGGIATSLVDRARDRYPAATVTASAPEGTVVEAPTVLEDALWELVENACEHAGEYPTVEVRVDPVGTEVELTVADDGPGLPRHERRVLEAGEETALQHGSGLGLWLAHWTVEAAGGTLGFAVEDGTAARVRLPMAEPDPRGGDATATTGD